MMKIVSCIRVINNENIIQFMVPETMAIDWLVTRINEDAINPLFVNQRCLYTGDYTLDHCRVLENTLERMVKNLQPKPIPIQEIINNPKRYINDMIMRSITNNN